MIEDVPRIFEAVFQCTLEVGESFLKIGRELFRQLVVAQVG